MAPVLFSAVTSSTRQLLMLLRCISFSKKAQVRIAADGLRFSCEEGSMMEASIFLEKSLFTTYTYNASDLDPDSNLAHENPLFEVSLPSLLETLNIFALSDPSASRRAGGEIDAFSAHRLNRHAAIDAFSSRALGVSGTCTLSYDGQGSALSIYMSETGVATTCDLTTYQAESVEDIPFDRDVLALKTIMPANHLLDASNELLAMTPADFIITANPTDAGHDDDGAGGEEKKERGKPELSLTAAGVLGSVTVNFTTLRTPSDEAVLETFQCPRSSRARFSIAPIKAAQRAMASASKVSLRLDRNGVLSMQFLVELGPSSHVPDAVAFVDFRAVPLVELGDQDGDSESSSE